MAKEILLYGDVDEYLAIQVITDLNNAKDEDIRIRVNTPGGSTAYNYGMIAKFSEHPKGRSVMVDGMAYSAGFYFCVNADYVECLDVSVFLLHRAAFNPYYEGNPDWFTDAKKAQLNNINSKFEKALSNKLDIEALQEIMDSKPELNGAKFKDIFSLESRIDVFLNAKEAKRIGLVDKIINITPAKKAEINAQMELVTAKYFGLPNANNPKQESSKPNPIMDLTTLKNNHPALYNEIIALGKIEGAAEEKDRVEAWMEFADIDAKAVAEGVASGKAPSMKNISEFSRKAMSKDMIKAAEEDAPAATKLPTAKNPGESGNPEGDAKAQALKDFEAETQARLSQKLGTTVATA